MASKTVHYMEKKSRHGNRFWQIEINKRSTVVRCGKTKLLDRGRLFPPRIHSSLQDALKFVKRNVKKKRSHGYVLKRGKTAAKYKPREKKVKTAKLGKGKVKPTNGAKKKVKPAMKTPHQALHKASQVKKNVTKTTGGKKAEGKQAAPPPRLQKQATLPVPVTAQPDRVKPVTSAQPSLLKQQSLTVGSGKVYIPSKSKWPITMDMPIAWRFPFKSKKSCAYGIHVDENHCMFGHQDGSVVELDQNGKMIRLYKLDSGVKCITQDGEFLYVGCDDGALYDLTHMEPRKMCEIENFGKVYWLDILRGILSASDENGSAAVVNYEGEIIWRKSSTGRNGWTVRMDDTGVYHGHSRGVTKYSMQNGQHMWHCPSDDMIFFGVQSEDHIHIAEGKYGRKIDKQTGKSLQTYHGGNKKDALCNEAAHGLVFLSDTKDIRCFDEETGKLVYHFRYPDKKASDDLDILSMKFYQGRLYCVGAGEFKVVDLSEAAIKTIQSNQKLKAVELHMDTDAPVVAPLSKVDSVTSEEAAKGGIWLHCVKEKGKLRIKPLSDGYNKKLNCQFPKVIRKVGAKYLVEELRETKYFKGTYYRVFGFIKEIND